MAKNLSGDLQVASANRLSDGSECTKLVNDEREDFVVAHRQFTPAKMLAIFQARMRPDRDAALFRRPH